MFNELKTLEAIAPDLMEIIQRRFRVLRSIYWMQPIGRRNLAEHLGLTERVLRTETDLLKDQQLISSSKSGMFLTDYGIEVMRHLEVVMDKLLEMDQIEQRLAEHFNIARCLIVSGDSEEQPKVVGEFGDLVNKSLDHLLPDGENIIAVMGGTTMAEVAEHITNLERATRHNIFVPARGGIGEAVAIQANSVSSMMAANAHGSHRSLFIPEQLSEETYETLIKEPSIQEVLCLINKSNCVIHSIGRALHMAARRKMTEEEIVMLRHQGAVAESFGHFFDERGKIVYSVPKAGLDIEKLQQIPIILAVAGGKPKAKAIAAYMKNAPKQTWLITDEAAAIEILKGKSL